MLKSALVAGCLATNRIGFSQQGASNSGIPQWLLKQGDPAPDPNRPLSQSDKKLLADLFPFPSAIYSIVLADGSNTKPALRLPNGQPRYVEKVGSANSENQKWNIGRTTGPDSQYTYVYVHISNWYMQAEEQEGALLTLGTQPFAWILASAADKLIELGNFNIRMANKPELVIDYAPDLNVLLKISAYLPRNVEGSQWQIWTLNQTG